MTEMRTPRRGFMCFAAAFMLLAAATSSAQEYRLAPIGVVDMDVIFDTFPEESTAIQGFVALRAEIERDQRSERRDLDDVTLELLDAKLAGDQKTVERKTLEVEDRTANYKALSEFWRRQLSSAREALSEDDFYLRFEKAVEYVAIDNKFSIIAGKGMFESLFEIDNVPYLEQKSLFVFAADEIDITDQVVLRIRTQDF